MIIYQCRNPIKYKAGYLIMKHLKINTAWFNVYLANVSKEDLKIKKGVDKIG